MRGVSTGLDKVSAMKSWSPPGRVSHLNVFLRTLGYYRKFMPDFATLETPLFQLEKKGRNFCGPLTVKIFYDTLKKVLCEGPVLAFLRFDLPFILLTDPSTTCVAAAFS